MSEAKSMAATEKGALLTQFDDAFFSQDDTQYTETNVAEWKGNPTIRMASLTADLLVAWFETNQRIIESLKTRENPNPNDKTNGYRMFVMSLVDANGNRIGLEADGLTPNTKLVNGFRKKNPAIMARLINKAMALNGLRKEDVEDRKNGSGEAAPSGSPTVSPSN